MSAGVGAWRSTVNISDAWLALPMTAADSGMLVLQDVLYWHETVLLCNPNIVGTPRSGSWGPHIQYLPIHGVSCSHPNCVGPFYHVPLVTLTDTACSEVLEAAVLEAASKGAEQVHHSRVAHLVVHTSMAMNRRSTVALQTFVASSSRGQTKNGKRQGIGPGPWEAPKVGAGAPAGAAGPGVLKNLCKEERPTLFMYGRFGDHYYHFLQVRC